MPRPGPRPYECVRRAWHSDRHQPIRGSLIQEIFRIANEIHSVPTKKKKEWQEKLPIVVLKAEEIMYSKANSEAEYMDLKTLWDRANDAINTIIRRDESTEENGEFLQPCIEAALHLGCVPRRASRSQRNNHPRGYLTGNVDLTNPTEGNRNPTSSIAPHCSNFLGKSPQNVAVPVNSCLRNEMPFLSSQNRPLGEGSTPSQSYPVYPLYYGIYSQPTEPQPHFDGPPTSNSIQDCSEMGMSQSLPLCNEEYKMTRRDQQIVPKDKPNVECDLSLRLGFGSVQRDEIGGLNDSQQKANFVSPKQESKDRFSLFCGSKAVSGSEILDIDFMVRKRKAVEQMQEQRYSWQPKLMPPFTKGGTRTAGL